MSSIALTHKLASTRGTGEDMTDLKGWQHVGYYGSSLIYALDNIRRLIDPATGQVIFQYRISEQSNTQR